ncbi:MAG: hemerythrin protein [Flavisolibacter sp.]|jgi:hemerythrin-like domain-containing protein|nr:hemerythrin protein [Flavisolibacter sp.]
MADEIKPIKRSKELAPLSREHHEGLLLGWKIKQGLKNGTDHKLISQYIQWFWDAELSAHFKKEEQVLAVHLPDENEWVMKMFADHEDIEALIHVNRMIPDEDIFLQIADALNEHIRFEERILFPYAETLIPQKDKETIYDELIKTEQHKDWEQEFWLNK